jgi:hypothetical protein
MMNGKFEHGDRVQWQEGGAGQFTCTGTVISEEKYSDGTNPHEFFCIRVDDEHYLRACHTAYEMSSHWVHRSVKFNKLRLLEILA